MSLQACPFVCFRSPALLTRSRIPYASLRNMFRRAWKPVAATVAVGGSGYYLYKTKFVQNTFEIPVRVKSADGKSEMSTRTLPLLSLKELEARMNERASTHSNPRPTGVIFNHTTASLASNHPIEDANSHQIVQRDKDDPLYPGDYIFYAVMDGHGGFNTSQVLSRVLINAVALELSELIKPGSKQQSSSGGAYASVKSLFYGSPTEQTQAILSSDPAAVSLAIQNAFTKLDNEIINAPLRVLANNINEESRKNKVIPDLSQHPLGLTTMLPAISGEAILVPHGIVTNRVRLGSCALMAVFDTANRDLYIACTGDSRAVAGAWEPTSDGKGIWRVEVLSEDQTGRNPNELRRCVVKKKTPHDPLFVSRNSESRNPNAKFTNKCHLRRVQSEHPADEADYVIRNGRVLGGLEPTRAFGDARYKWPRPIQETYVPPSSCPHSQSLNPSHPASTKPSWPATTKPCAPHPRSSRPHHM